MKNPETGSSTITEKRWAFPLAISTLLFIFLLATSFNMGLLSSLHTINSILWGVPSHNETTTLIVEVKNTSQPPPPPPLPRFAYLVSGSKGDLNKLWRTLLALYHPNNQYVVHLDLESPIEERMELVSRVEKNPVFADIGNVYVIQKSNMVTYRGPTMISNTLHAAAVLLRRSKEWDWFINLSASDYPLMTQDDLIYSFSKLDRSLNFIDHTSRLGWKAPHRGQPLIVDPGLYSSRKTNIFYVKGRRDLPSAFKLYTGSAWMTLSRAFVEYLIWGYDNLPRTLLMYYSNFISSPEHYFHTVICNSEEFAKTAANHDLHYIAWDKPPKQHPQSLTVNHMEKMLASDAPFARKFKQDDPVLDKIDRELLKRRNGSFTPGGWCAGKPKCVRVGDRMKLKPGPGAKRLDNLMSWAVTPEGFKSRQCK